MMSSMKVLLTGSRGYIGTVMTPMLQKAGHEVVGLDADLYSRCTFEEGGQIVDIPTIIRDTRDVRLEDVEGFDAIIHLAALSNDPLSDLNPSLTYDVNHLASVKIAELAKKAGVPKFIFASSCSNYGKTEGDEMIDETGKLAPVSAYGESKVLVERDVKPRLQGPAHLVRYADDVVIFFSREDDARRVMDVLPKRMEKYGLTLHPEKTRLVEFRRPNHRPPPPNGDGCPSSTRCPATPSPRAGRVPHEAVLLASTAGSEVIFSPILIHFLGHAS